MRTHTKYGMKIFEFDMLMIFDLLTLPQVIWDFGKLPFPTHLGKYFIKIGKIRAKIHEIGKIKAIFGLGMTPIYGLKNGQIKSLQGHQFDPRMKMLLMKSS